MANTPSSESYTDGEVEEIEGEEDKLIRAAFIHRSLEAAEDRHAVPIESAQLAVEVGGLHLQ